MSRIPKPSALMGEGSRRRARGIRRRLRVAFFATLALAPLVLLAADRLSQRRRSLEPGFRVVTVNVGTRPLDVAEALRALEPDVILMQETGVSCAAAARALGFAFQDGSDQCVVSRGPLEDVPLRWPGPWQPPQMLTTTQPRVGAMAMVNLRFAIPEVIAAVATLGKQWYTEGQRREQYAALTRIIGDRTPAIVCGDFNAFPLEVDLGPRFRDAWSGLRYGATFPAVLPAARIDQCWVTDDLEIVQAWTHPVPTDHRAVVVDLAPERSGVRR